MPFSHLHRHAAAVAAVFAVLFGCRQPDTAAPPAAPRHATGSPRLLSVSELSAAEQQYGHSAWRGAGVTYQPDVVIPAAGASAIRSLSADGLIWTIDPGAAGAAEIVPGKVLLLTSRAAGRVLAVEKRSEGLRVVLGPVEITEIIRDGQFSVEQPIDIAQALQFATPAAFDPAMPVAPLAAAAGTAPRYGIMPARFEVADNPVTVHHFKLLPYAGSNGVGVRIVSTGGGVQFLGESILYLGAPRVRFALDIRPPGRVVTAEVALIGLGGLQVKFEAAMAAPTDANISEKRFAAHDLSIPVGGIGGVPLALTVRQLFQLRTVFTSTGNIKAGGSYTLSGGLSAGYRDGGFSVGGPTGFGAKYTLLPSIEGVAIGVTGLVMTHRVDVIVGIGAAGFVAGPYAHLNSSVSIARGSSVGFDAGVGIMGHGRTCRRESVDMAIGAGLGYQMPQPVTDAINFVLKALHIKERIQGRGGIEWKPTVIVSKGWYHPQAPWCGNP